MSLREKCPNTEFFLVRIFPYSDWIRKSPYSVRIRENMDQKKLLFGHFSRSGYKLDSQVRQREPPKIVPSDFEYQRSKPDCVNHANDGKSVQ